MVEFSQPLQELILIDLLAVTEAVAMEAATDTLMALPTAMVDLMEAAPTAREVVPTALVPETRCLISDLA